MASQKRRGSFDPDVDSDDEANPGSPISQSSSSKRRRLSRSSSLTSNASNHVNSDDDATTPPSDVDPEEDTDEDSREDAEDFATQREETRKRNQSDDCGILEKVEIINFMCHKHYVFDLGPRINFICGKNGSGKSAILTAIILCLGGKASATNRASSLRDLIRQGQDHASIICYVKNSGDGPYMPEVYGQRISIERHFSKSGTAGFKLRNYKGKIISTKKGDLDDICDHFGFQVENPMSVLSQDLARQFITTSSPAEKYKLFVKGVLLEQLDQDYSLIEQQVGTFNPKIEDSKQDLKGLENQAELARSKAEASERFQAMRDTFREWRRQLMWEAVRLREVEKEESDTHVQNANKKIEEAETDKVELQAAFDQINDRRDAAKRNCEEADARVQSIRDEKKEQSAKQAEAKQHVTEAQAEHRTVKGTIDGVRKSIADKEKQITEEMERLAELDGGGAARRIRELEEAKAAVAAADEEQKRHDESRVSIKARFDAAQANETEAKGRIGIQTAEVQRQQQRLDNIRKESRLTDDVFHPRMPQLLKAIQQENRFQTRPIGPIGKHVKLLYPEWSSILEKSFGGTLNGFVVTNKADQDLLWSMQKRSGITNVQNFLTNNTLLETRAHEPDESHLTILRALEIDDPLVRKTLIMQHFIENSGLIQDQREASRLLFPGNGAQPPRNLPRCYCFHPMNKTKGFLLQYKGKRPAQDPIDSWHGPTRMRTNLDDQIRIQEGLVNDAKSQQRDLEADLQSCKDVVKKTQQELKRWKSISEQLKVATQTAEALVETLSEEIDQDVVNKGNLDTLRNSLTAFQGQLEVHEGSYIDVRGNLDEKKTRLTELTRELDQYDERIRECVTAATTEKKKYQDVDRQRMQALGELNSASARIEDGEKDRRRLEELRDGVIAEVTKATAEARTISERVNFPDGETYESLRAKYDRRVVELRNAEKRIGGTREELATEKARTAAAHADAKSNIDRLTLLSNTIHDTMHNRRKRWWKFQRFISAGAKLNFSILLSEREFRGELVLDHEKKLLDLRVEPDITKKSDKGRLANTLSGGEKSFAQICLLLAIWEAMGSPIRCLDEFDVFMDAVNRNRSASLLIDGARNSTGKQFILISPGLKEDIPQAEDVHRIEVAQPERGQTQLSFRADGGPNSLAVTKPAEETNEMVEA